MDDDFPSIPRLRKSSASSAAVERPPPPPPPPRRTAPLPPPPPPRRVAPASDDDDNDSDDLPRPTRRAVRPRVSDGDDDDDEEEAEDIPRPARKRKGEGRKNSLKRKESGDSGRVKKGKVKRRRTVDVSDDESGGRVKKIGRGKLKSARYSSSDGGGDGDYESEKSSDGGDEVALPADGHADYSEDDDSFGSADEGPGKKGGAGGRLTMRQRTMKGEDLELAKLASPVSAKKKKKKPALSDDITKDEERAMKVQQKARLRNMVHEKRNKEKRAAMVDKVLRGVTSKRKKLSMAAEEHAAETGARLAKNEAREGCYRYTSNAKGSFFSVPADIETPPVLAQACGFAGYPPKCERDPKTGKRILPGGG